MKGYKGFDKELKCRGMQYEIGKEHICDSNLSLCNSGLHFTENPLDTFGYYDPATSRYAEVEADEVSDETSGDSKRVAKRLKISTEVSLSNLCNLAVKFILDKVDFKDAPATNTGYQSAATNTGYRSAATNTGYQSAATNTGDQSAATNTGYQGAATNTGYQSAATNTGQEGCAVSLGIEGRAKGAVGCWITLAEWEEKKDKWHRVDVQTVKVDGKKIKADTFYVLTGGKFTEAK